MRLAGRLQFQRERRELSGQTISCLLIESSAATGEWLHVQRPVPVDGVQIVRGLDLNLQFDTTVDQIRQKYATTVSQMRCPYHHKHAWVEVEDGRFNTFHIDVVTCCQEFEQRVRKSLMDTRGNS